MGQSVACLNGGYDYKFNHGENTKLNLENRTPEKYGNLMRVYMQNQHLIVIKMIQIIKY